MLHEFREDIHIRMSKFIHFVIIVFLVNLIDVAIAESSLSPDALKLVGEAVFEIVVPKPTTDSLTYEHPLPLHLIPYAVRTDKYYSIGTAFAIGTSEFVTAAHVMNLSLESQFKEVCLRDKDGNVYEIEMITKYSEQRDFVVFSVKGKTINNFFQINASPRINQEVFAVGNALGEGIVIRNGLYTSSTPEEEEGVWRWLRFSAAASPGNSGGPLLDAEGKVIGIVLQKSPNENLNIALPITEVVNARENVAIAHKMLKYSLDNFRVAMLPTFHKEIVLPKPYNELNRELIDGLKLLHYNTMRELFKKNRNSVFPNGRGSDIVLHAVYDVVFPNLIMQGEAGVWNASRPGEIREAELLNDGRMRYGIMGNTLFLYIQKPADISLDNFCNNSKLFMDLILKGLSLPRKIGNEETRITSMGKSAEHYVFTDSYGRNWLVKSWNLEYNDEKVVTFSLPIPGGCITLMRSGQTGLVNAGYIPELKMLTNFIYISYNSTLKKWREFLQMKEILPTAFAGIDISFEYNKVLHYTSKRFSFSYTPELMEIHENSLLRLSFNFFKEKDKTIWDVSAVSAGEDKNRNTFVAVGRKIKPAKELGEVFQRDWEDTEANKFPFNRKSYPGDKITSIGTVLKQPGTESNKILYTVVYGHDGKVEQAEMEGKIDRFLRDLKVNDYGQGDYAVHNTGRKPYHDNCAYFLAVWNLEEVSMQPCTSDGFILRGNIHQENGDMEQAMANYDEAISMTPGYALGYYYRGIAYKDKGNSDLALADFSMATKLNPRHAEAFLNRGAAYRDLGNFSNSIADSDKAIEINPNYIEAYNERGITYGRKGEISTAMKDFNRALELDPDNVDAYNNRGFTYKVQGDFSRALSDFNRSIELNPEYSLAYINRGNTYAQQKDSTKACSDWKRACELGSCVNYLNARKSDYCN